MNFWVVSPNVSKNSAEEPYWKQAILENGLVFIGWNEDHNLGDTFINSVKKGDIILIAQGANWQKRLFLCGEVASDAIYEHVQGTPRSTYNRKLINIIEKQELENLKLDFSGSAYGEASQIPAIYRLKPNDNLVDKAIAERLHAGIKHKKKQMAMMDKVSLLKYKKQIILQGPPGTGKTYAAKDIAESIIFGKVSVDKKVQEQNLHGTEQFRLIQFHPAYSYEDFVRGISAKSNGTAITYKTENKILAEFAQRALENLLDSGKDKIALSKEKWVQNELELYADNVQNIIDQNGRYPINNTVSIFEVEEDAFRYKGNTWEVQTMQRMKFSDIALALLNDAHNRRDIKAIPGISGRSKEHASYDFMLLEKFREFLNERPAYRETNVQVEKKSYVLVIDEINRANLPAVLGELIYALEYRDNEVKSMYELDGNSSIVIPSNLFIIGTMNTADRSVGHIDYAIRRRFSFVDVLPNPAPIKDFAMPVFKSVSSLFIKNFDSIVDWSNPILERSDYLAMDFRPDDVWLGHSYFIADDEASFKIKIKYEIKPILKEYLKDGVLMESAKQIVDALS